MQWRWLAGYDEYAVAVVGRRRWRYSGGDLSETLKINEMMKMQWRWLVGDDNGLSRLNVIGYFVGRWEFYEILLIVWLGDLAILKFMAWLQKYPFIDVYLCKNKNNKYGMMKWSQSLNIEFVVKMFGVGGATFWRCA